MLRALAPVGPLRVDRVVLTDDSNTIHIARPSEFDGLLDTAAVDPEQNLPYWAEIWPSGVALAEAIARDPTFLTGQRVLELGCGLGVTAIAALRAGADLLVTDYAQEALDLCGLNALNETGREPRTLRVNWRASSAALLRAAENGFPIILAADVLYEIRDLEPLLDLVQCLVTPGGEVWLAEPGRVPATLFVETMMARGWSQRQELFAGPWPDPEDNRKGVVVTVHRIRQEAGGVKREA